MAGMAIVSAHEMQMIARHVDRAGVGRRPETDQQSRDRLEAELRLPARRADEIGTRRGLAGDAISDLLEVAAHADGGEDVVAWTQGVYPASEIVPVPDVIEDMPLIGDEMSRDPEGSARVRGRLVNGAIAARLPASAVDQQTLAVETVESAQAEIAVAQNIGDPHAAAKNALDQSARGRH